MNEKLETMMQAVILYGGYNCYCTIGLHKDGNWFAEISNEDDDRKEFRGFWNESGETPEEALEKTLEQFKKVVLSIEATND